MWHKATYCCVVALSVLLLLPACKKGKIVAERVVVDKQELDIQRQVILDNIVQQEAMLVNIPIPLYDERILPQALDFLESETSVLGYSSSLIVQQLIDFFMSQMELYGWKHLVSFESNETILIFENPYSYACISLKHTAEQKTLIFIYTKRADL